MVFDADDWNPEVAKREAEKLRREFAETMAKVMKDPEYFHKLAQGKESGPGQDDPFIPPEPASERASRQLPERRDVLGDGRLMKKCLRAVKKDAPKRWPRYGDEVVCLLDASVGGVTVVRSSAGRVSFVVGALEVPQMLSACAVETALGETTDFEVASSLALGDDRFEAGAATRAWLAAAGAEYFETACNAPARVQLQIIAIRSPDQPEVRDISGGLGLGNVLMRVIHSQQPRQAYPTSTAATSDVVYERSVFAPQPSDPGWPRSDNDGTRAHRTPADAADSIGLSAAALADARELEPTNRRISKCSLSRAWDTDDDVEGMANYVERLIVDTLQVGDAAIIALSPRAARDFGDFEHLVLVSVRPIKWMEYVDCAPNHPGAVVKRTLRRGEGCWRPRNADVVVVRGVLRVRGDRQTVACAYGAEAVTTETASTFRAPFATWVLDEDASARIGDVAEVQAPLCAGVELAVATMVQGEVAEVVIAAPQMALVRAPPSAKPPSRAKPTDIHAFHYSTEAYRAVPVAAFSRPLIGRLELVDRRPLLDSLIVRANPAWAPGLSDSHNVFTRDALQKALDDALDLKARATKHFKAKAFARAARRYSDALVAVAAGRDAARMLSLVERPKPIKTTVADIIDDGTLPSGLSPQPEPPDPSQIIVQQLVDLESTLRLNRAACDLKRCQYDRCVADCEVVLKKRPQDLKATYRAGLAHLSLRHFEKARELFDTCITIDPKCVDARRGLVTLDDIERHGKNRAANQHGVDASDIGSCNGAEGTFSKIALTRRRPRDSKGGPDQPPAPTLSVEELYEQRYLGDLNRGKPPWLRDPEPPAPAPPDPNPKPNKRPLAVD